MLGSELARVRQALLDAKKSIAYYQSPLDDGGAPALDKRAMLKAIARLEAIVTSRAFQRFDELVAGK